MAASFDRSKPLYRLFDMEDGTFAWHVVDADNTPGRALDYAEVSFVTSVIEGAPWRDAFYAALERNMKATVYQGVS